MAELDRAALLAHFSRSTLTVADRRALFEAAIDDQALFDTLAEEDELRELLEHPQTRPVVRERTLKAPPPLRTAGFRVPLAMAASLLVVGLATAVLWRARTRDVLQVSRHTPEAAVLWAEADAVPKSLAPLDVQVTLATGPLGPARFAPGEPLRLEVRTSAEARVVALVRAQGSEPRLLLPALESPPLRVGASLPLVIDPGNGLRAPLAAGSYQLRVLVARAADADDLASFRQRVAAGEVAAADVVFVVVR